MIFPNLPIPYLGRLKIKCWQCQIITPIVTEQPKSQLHTMFVTVVLRNISNFCINFLTRANLLNNVTAVARLRCDPVFDALLALRVLCKRNRRVDVVESQYASSPTFSWFCAQKKNSHIKEFLVCKEKKFCGSSK